MSSETLSPPASETTRLRGSWLRRHRRLVLGLALLAGLALLGGPQAWALYHWERAQAELERYHGPAALEHLDACLRVWPWLRLWPSRAQAHLLASRAARLAGDYQSADRHLRAAERLLPEGSEEIALEWALLHASSGDLSESVEDYLLKRAEKDPGVAPLAREALAEGYLRNYRIREAFSCLNRWLKLQPDNVRALALRAEVWRTIKRLKSAVPDYRRLVELDPEQDGPRFWLALGLFEGGQYRKALDHLEALSGRLPGPDVPILEARCRAALGQFEQARKGLDAILAEHPDNGLALRARGEVELKAGQAVRAEPWLRRAIRVMPNDYLAQFWLYNALNEQNKEKEAAAQDRVVHLLKDRLDRLDELTSGKLSARPHDPALRCELGKLLLQLGSEQAGERWLYAALAEDPHYRPAHAALAELYQARGDREQAAYHREQADAADTGGSPKGMLP
jgi:predicted Zn-dependent protease